METPKGGAESEVAHYWMFLLSTGVRASVGVGGEFRVVERHGTRADRSPSPKEAQGS